MRNKLLTILLAFLPLCVVAQTYTVYSIVGTVKYQNGKSMLQLTPRKAVTTQTKVQIEPESAVTMIDEQHAKMYSFATPGIHTIGQLVESSKSTSKSLSKQYMSYVIKQLFNKESQEMTHPDTYMQATATAYRSSSSDSLLLNQIAALLPANRPETIEQLLCDTNVPLTTDFDVRFDLIDCATGSVLDGQIAPNTSCYLRVSNRTAEVLYMNLLDIDRQGNKYLVLPMDAASTCAHLLVPPMCTVSFKAEPFIFGEEPMEETLILMAVKDPVDFSIVMNPIRKGSGGTIPVGLNRKFYQVK